MQPTNSSSTAQAVVIEHIFCDDNHVIHVHTSATQRDLYSTLTRGSQPDHMDDYTKP